MPTEPKLYRCADCGLEFKSKYQLKTHRPYCRTRNKAFPFQPGPVLVENVTQAMGYPRQGFTEPHYKHPNAQARVQGEDGKWTDKS